jgi:predicted AAA+ superfamily ATPase
MHIRRILTDILIEDAKKAPVIAILGPRQSGKTTVAREAFAEHTYISLEDYDVRDFAATDPRRFLQGHENPHGIILDEVQHVPALLSYIQTSVDLNRRPGYYILTGSQNFTVNQAITQTLAGRISIHTLLPLSIAELRQADMLPETAEGAMLKGLYPIIYAQEYSPVKWYRDYLRTYVERDVRTLGKVDDLSTFIRFLKLCAGRIGQNVNFSSLANDAGISPATAKAWLSILEASYVIFLLQPHYKNFSKRLVKTPKLFFYDPGLACSLLGIEQEEQLHTHYMRGGLFEAMMIADLYKQFYNADRAPHLYFWGDKQHEVDCIVEQADRLYPIEIKAGQTVSGSYFTGLNHWNALAQADPAGAFVIYAGDTESQRSAGTVIGWKRAGELVARIASIKK